MPSTRESSSLSKGTAAPTAIMGSPRARPGPNSPCGQSAETSLPQRRVRERVRDKQHCEWPAHCFCATQITAHRAKRGDGNQRQKPAEGVCAVTSCLWPPRSTLHWPGRPTPAPTAGWMGPPLRSQGTPSGFQLNGSPGGSLNVTAADF